ncbi:SusC/RagA family TonB-linked outer membrane protein [Riemerella anatipestifer]|nr:SusC/RagA family TonB-linked outer membrane protein [Riemerella anatipestifer]
MNVKLRALTAGAVFFIGAQSVVAQKAKKDSVREIEEVVMVGYSKVKKEDYVGTATSVSMKSVEGKNVSTISQALTGEASGVRVITTSGQPGSEPKIRVRGFGSVNGNREPLYVLDGVPYSGNVSAINPDDIESMSVLKDATATAIYGARGANGVVLINTKKGKVNRSQITLESKVGFNFAMLPRYDRISSPEEYLEISWNAMYNKGVLSGAKDPVAYANANLFGRQGINSNYNMWKGTAADLIDPTTGKFRAGVERLYSPEKWQDYAFQTSIRTENNLSISGGAGKTTYYTGLGYLKDEGYSINSSYERYSGRLNVSHQAKPWLKGEFNMGYAFAKTKNNGQTSNSGSVFWFVDNIPSIYPLFLRDSSGNTVTDPYFGGKQYDYGEKGRGFGALTNSIADATYNLNSTQRHEVNANFFLQADITPNLSFETRLGGQYFDNVRSVYNNPYYGGAASQQGSLGKYRTDVLSYNFLQLLRYKNKFGDGHRFEIFGAHENNSWERNYLGVSKFGLIIPDGKEFNNAISQNPAYSYIYNYTLESYFGQLSYDYKNKYLLSASLRRDGSSRFLNDKWDTFYSLGLGWVVSKEDFLKDSQFLRNLKLKASYGAVGDQSIVDSEALDQNMGYYPGYVIYEPGNFMGLPAASFNRLGYPLLTWEKSKIFQTGVEFSLFKNKALEVNVDYYHKTTDQLIFDNRLAPSTGNAIMKVNDGLLVNQGVEFNLVGHIINKDDFYLDLSVNGEFLRNKLKRMPIDFATGKERIIDLSSSGFGRAQGHSLYDYYMREYRGVNSNTGAAMWTMHYHDVNNDGKFNEKDDVVINSLYEYQVANPNAKIVETTTEDYSQATQKFLNKSALPDLRGAFTLSTGYKNWSLSVQMLYSIGGYAYDGAYANLMSNGQIGGNNWHTDIRNRWQNPGDVTDVPRLSSNYTKDTRFNAQSSRFLTKSDYLALNNVRLAYSVPKEYYQALGINGLTLSVSGDNLWIYTKRKGFNPTTSETGASSIYTYSPLSTITFGVRANF